MAFESHNRIRHNAGQCIIDNSTYLVTIKRTGKPTNKNTHCHNQHYLVRCFFDNFDNSNRVHSFDIAGTRFVSIQAPSYIRVCALYTIVATKCGIISHTSRGSCTWDNQTHACSAWPINHAFCQLATKFHLNYVPSLSKWFSTSEISHCAWIVVLAIESSV